MGKYSRRLTHVSPGATLCYAMLWQTLDWRRECELHRAKNRAAKTRVASRQAAGRGGKKTKMSGDAERLVSQWVHQRGKTGRVKKGKAAAARYGCFEGGPCQNRDELKPPGGCQVRYLKPTFDMILFATRSRVTVGGSTGIMQAALVAPPTPVRPRGRTFPASASF